MAEINIFPQYKPFFTSPKRFNVVYGGRGRGATWNISRGILVRACEERLRILCTREYQNSIDESVYYALISQIEMLGIEKNFNIQKTHIESITGSRFIFKGLRHNIDSIKSMEDIDIVWISEADKVPQLSLDKLIPTIRAKDSCFYIDFNTDSTDDPVYRMFVDQKRDDTRVLFQTYKDNQYFPEVLRVDMEHCKATDYDKYQWIWEGNIREISDACIFKGKFRVDEFSTPDNAEFYHGVDWGFSQDPLAVIRSFVKDEVLYIDMEAGGVGVDIDKTAELFDKIPTMRRWTSYADNARPELISHMKGHGFPSIKACKKGKGSIEDGIAKIRSFKEVVIHPRCVNTIEEFKLYKYKVNATNGDIMPVPEDKNNHWIDALRYSLERYGRGTANIHRY